VAELEAATIDQEPRFLTEFGPRIYKIAGLIGIVALAATFVLSLATGELRHFCYAYLTNFCYVLSLSLGGLFFVALQHVARAGWSVVVRRLAEVVAANLALLAVLSLPILLSVTVLYGWTHEPHGGHAELLESKAPYLNVPFFIVRFVGYFAIWALMARYFLKRSLEQDRTGDVDLTIHLSKVGAVTIVVYAVTITFGAFDLIMSLTPEWYSTIFGVYYFSGSMVGFLSLATLLAMWLQSKGLLREAITREHYHDVGKLLFGFVFFWGYISFSQYMLIWYGNIPEETQYYLVRQSRPWMWVSLALLFLHFFVPFVGLLSRHVKRRKLPLAFWSAWMLAMHWIDVYWLIMPTYAPDRVPFGPMEIGCLIGLVGLFLAGLAHVAGDRSLVPEKDPRLDESLEFENT
jgi:hypothetical protein